MPGKTSQYTAARNAQLELAVLDVLNTHREAMTIDQIKSYNYDLIGVSSQKMSRILSKLIDLNFARKGHSKQLNRMLYKSAAVMKEEGYDVDGD